MGTTATRCDETRPSGRNSRFWTRFLSKASGKRAHLRKLHPERGLVDGQSRLWTANQVVTANQQTTGRQRHTPGRLEPRQCPGNKPTNYSPRASQSSPSTRGSADTAPALEVEQLCLLSGELFLGKDALVP
jgi:hypothetical protein